MWNEDKYHLVLSPWAKMKKGLILGVGCPPLGAFVLLFYLKDIPMRIIFSLVVILAEGRISMTTAIYQESLISETAENDPKIMGGGERKLSVKLVSLVKMSHIIYHWNA